MAPTPMPPPSIEERALRSPDVMERGTPLKLFKGQHSRDSHGSSGAAERPWTPPSSSKPKGGSARLYGSSTSSAQAEARRAAQSSREARMSSRGRRAAPPKTPADGRGPRRFNASPVACVSAERSGLESLESGGSLNTEEVRAGGMDIGVFQAKRVLQDVEQTVREKSRREELDKLKRQRDLPKKKAEADRRDRVMADKPQTKPEIGEVTRGWQAGDQTRRSRTKSKNHEREAALALEKPSVAVAAATRGEAGFSLLLQVLAEAGDEGKGDLGEAAGLARYKAEQADPLILADFLVTRCEGLSELVLDITDQLTAEVMGLRHAAPVQEAEGSVETGVVRTWTPDTAFLHNQHPSAELGAHPFADAETLDFILDQLLLTISTAARISAGQSPRGSVCRAGETLQPTETAGAPMSMMDTIMSARFKAQAGSDIYDDQTDQQDRGSDICYHCRQPGHWKVDCPFIGESAASAVNSARRDGNKLWSTLNAKRKMAMVSNDTVAQIAPILLKYGLMDFAKDLKKYGFHQLPQLRKASVGQLVQIGMSSMQAKTLLLAVSPSAVPGSRGSARTLPHGITVEEDAWFHKKKEKRSNRQQQPVMMKDLHAPFRKSPRYKDARRSQKQKLPEPEPESELEPEQEWNSDRRQWNQDTLQLEIERDEDAKMLPRTTADAIEMKKAAECSSLEELLLVVGLELYSEALQAAGFVDLDGLVDLAEMGKKESLSRIGLRAGAAAKLFGVAQMMRAAREQDVRADGGDGAAGGLSISGSNPALAGVDVSPSQESVDSQLLKSFIHNPFDRMAATPPPRSPTTESEKRRTLMTDYERGVKEKARALAKDMREEQEADSWLKAQPLAHRVSRVDARKQHKGVVINSTINKKSDPAAHVKAFSAHGTSNHTYFSGTNSQSFGVGLAGVDERHSREFSSTASLSARAATEDRRAVGHTGGLAGWREHSRTSASFAENLAQTGGTLAQIAAAQSSSELAQLDDEIQLGMSSAPRQHVYVGDPRFIPTDLTQVHRGNASYSGREFINRWSSLQSHSPRSIEERKQMMRIDKAWQPKTVRSFRVDRALI